MAPPLHNNQIVSFDSHFIDALSRAAQISQYVHPGAEKTRDDTGYENKLKMFPLFFVEL